MERRVTPEFLPPSDLLHFGDRVIDTFLGMPPGVIDESSDERRLTLPLDGAALTFARMSDEERAVVLDAVIPNPVVRESTDHKTLDDLAAQALLLATPPESRMDEVLDRIRLNITFFDARRARDSR